MFMQYLLVINSSIENKYVHECVLELLSKFDEKERVLKGIFISSNAVSLCSLDCSDKALQDSYVKQALRLNLKMLVCGRAFSEAHLDKDRVQDGFELSGNMELSMLISEVDKVLEF